MIETIKKIGPLKFAGIAVGVLISIIILVLLSAKLASPPLSLLYTNLSSEDSALISSRLESMGEPHQVSNGGKDVSVPVGRVLALRMSFAQEGIPHSGSIVGYEIFDKNEGLGTSQFVYNVNLVRALEGEISRTIASLNQIESARVHLVMPKKELFNRANTEPSASVVVKMKGSQTLNKQEVAAISHIVATAVPGLRVDSITIVDNHGRPLKLANTDESGSSLMSDAATDFQKAIEEKYKQVLEELIEKSVGVGKVKANVAAEINFDREITNSEIYDPEGQVVRSRKVSEVNDKEQSSSNEIGIATNLQGAQGGSGGAGGPNHNKNSTDEVTNYEISRTVTNRITESGRIKKLSIAILVDGVYNIKQSEDGKTQEFVYNPRSEAEVEKIKTLAMSAVGVDSKRGDKLEVINMQFSEEFASLPQKEAPFAWLRNELDNIVQTIVIGLVIILVMLLIVRPVVLKSLEHRRAALEEQAIMDGLAVTSAEGAAEGAKLAVPGQSSADPAIVVPGADEDLAKLLTLSPSDRKRAQLIKYINDMVEKHPDETVAVIRGWLYASN